MSWQEYSYNPPDTLDSVSPEQGGDGGDKQPLHVTGQVVTVARSNDQSYPACTADPSSLYKQTEPSMLHGSMPCEPDLLEGLMGASGSSSSDIPSMLPIDPSSSIQLAAFPSAGFAELDQQASVQSINPSYQYHQAALARDTSSSSWNNSVYNDPLAIPDWLHSASVPADSLRSPSNQRDARIDSELFTGPRPGLPRRKSQYSLASSNPRPIPIPARGRSTQGLDPMQRWRESPPETEAASFSAIFDALQNGPPLHNSQARTTGVSSSPSVASGWSHSSSSVASTRSARSSWGPGPRRTSSGRVTKTKRGTAATRRLNEERRTFCCTFCCDTFKKKHDWTRHEKSLHLNCEQWVCAPFGGVVVSPATLESRCAYCNAQDPTVNHLQKHNHSLCHNGQQPHHFRRKDHLVQHLRGIHQLDDLPAIEDWKLPPPVITSRCGFCDVRLDSWQARADHLAGHFHEGKTMADWKGDHEFEPSIASQVRNAMPPYLLDYEANTVAPFSATNPTTSEHIAQQLRDHRGVINTGEGEGRWGKDIPPPDPGFEVTITSWTRFLAWHLGRFAQQVAAMGVAPTDEMFQDEARRLMYGNDDNWEHTIADNEEWMAAFRRLYLAGQ